MKLMFDILFVLLFQTDLCGIKWRKFVHCSAGPEGPPDWGGGSGGGTNACGSVLEDPVLSSYTRCLTHDMLAVWRRVSLPPANSQQTSLDPLVPAPPTPVPALPPALSLKASKELWIFWYGDEPDLNGLVSPQLLLNGNTKNIYFMKKIYILDIDIHKYCKNY